MRQKSLLILFLVSLFQWVNVPLSGAVIYENTDIDTDTTWTATDVHLVQADISVPDGVTLTISPGTVIKFEANHELRVEAGATLLAVGTAAEKIVFTSYRDDTFGGDTNGDGASTGAPGDWDRISLNQSSGSRLEHTVVRYAGSGNAGSIYIYQSDMPVLSSEVSHGQSHGIYTFSASPELQGNTIADNGQDGIRHNGSGSPVDRDNTITGNGNDGIHVASGTPTIDNNQITGNAGYGVYFTVAVDAPEITQNTITGNDKPVRLPFSSLPGAAAGNTLSPNTHNQIEFWGNTLSRDLVLPIDPVAVYCQVNNRASVAEGYTLTLEPGMIWKVGASQRLQVEGTLLATGTAAEKIVFTSYRDDTFGGDTNGDGASTGVPGDWDRISLNESSGSRLEHTVVRYAGSGNMGSIYIYQSDMPILSSEVSHGQSHGIFTYSASPRLEGNTIADNGQDGIHHTGSSSPIDRNNDISGNGNDGIHVASGTPTIDDNRITGNTGYGIYFTGPADAPEITQNTITGNDKPVRLPFSSLPGAAAGNTLSPNTHNQIEFWGNTLSRDLVLPIDPVAVYCQVNNRASVAEGYTLTLEPGMIWKVGASQRLQVEGTLLATGTAAEKIVFTSYRDDTFGGDTNGDGASTGVPGDWDRISLNESSGSRLEHTVVRYAGSGNMGSIYIYQSDMPVLSSEVSHGQSHGIYTYSASPRLEGNTIADNGQDGIHHTGSSSPIDRNNDISGNGNDGIHIASGTPTIDDNQITGNTGWGIWFQNPADAPVITGNTITGNRQSAMLPVSAVPNESDGNTLAPNQVNALWIRGGDRNTDLVLPVLYPGTPQELRAYQINGQLTMTAGNTLTIQPGVVVKFDDSAGLVIDGGVSCEGTAEQPIVLTSFRDDTYGGDLNLDGYATSPANGDWRGIRFNDTADDGCVISHTDIHYGGGANSGAVYSYQRDLTIENSVISNSSSNGLRLYRADLILTNSELFANSGDGVHLESTGTHSLSGCRLFANFGDGVETASSATTITGSEIFANLGYGVRNTAGTTITATENWWGAPDGPSGFGPGSGDEIGADVGYDPVVTDGTEFHYFDAGGSAHDAYGVMDPIVTGTGSTEWGTAPPLSFLYQLNPGQIVAEYTGLSDTTPYQLLLTYLNNDEGGGSQSLTNANGDPLHPALKLPGGNPVSYLFPAGRDSVDGGNLRLHFNGLSGLRTIVCGIFLMETPSTDSIPPEIHLEAPANNAVLSGGKIMISGTVSDAGVGMPTVEVGILMSGNDVNWQPITSISNSGDWTFRWLPPADGEYVLRARAVDRTGNIQVAPETPVITVDGTAPSPVTHLFAEGLSGVAGTMRVSWILSSDDGRGANDVTGYRVYRSEERLTGYHLVGQVAAGTSRLDDVTISHDVDYFYYVKTVDGAGNGADSTVVGPARSTGVIDDTAPEDVTQLTASTTQVGGTQCSAVLTWTGSVDSQGDLVDQLLYVSRDGTLFGSNPPDYDNSMPYALGRDRRTYQEGDLTVGETYTFKMTTVDEVPNESAGTTVTVTPGSEETDVVSLEGDLAADMSIQQGVFHVASTNLTIPEGKTLTLGPGTIIKMGAGRRITVYGRLFAQGTPEAPVVFTSDRDDNYGGDTNGDGLSTGAAGDWDRIYLYQSSSSRLEHTVVRYAGSGNSGSIYLYQSDTPVLSSEISDGASHGIYTYNASPELENNSIHHNGGNGVHHIGSSTPLDRNNSVHHNAYGIYSQNSAAAIHGNDITDNTQDGVHFTTAADAPTLTGNTITGNGGKPVLVPASALPDDTNVLTPNGEAVIGLLGNIIQGDKHLTVRVNGSDNPIDTYVVYDSHLTVPIYTFLTIDPAITVKLDSNVRITVDGALIAEGTAEDPIVFTALADDSYGGDTNSDGGDTLPVNGDWGGIRFNDSYFEDLSHLNYVKILYAGSYAAAAVYMYQADIRIENSEIANSSGNGVRAYTSAPTLTGNTIWGNREDGIRLEGTSQAEISFSTIAVNGSDGIELVSSSSATATNNRIFMNRDYGIYNSTIDVIDATQNWWGDSDGSGPYHADTNSDGTGNAVSDNVSFEPFQTEVALPFSYRNFSETAGGTYGDMPAPTLAQGTPSDIWDETEKRPDRTMVYDSDRVILDYTGLNPQESYLLQTSYFDGDAKGVWQYLTDGDGKAIHGPLPMPGGTPVQYRFPIPGSHYADGTLTLQFILTNPGEERRAAVTECWLIEQAGEITPPSFEALHFNDRDGSSTLTVGDAYHFIFSEAMDPSVISDGSTDADAHLGPEGDGKSYGEVNTVSWSADYRTCVVTVTEGYTILGTETVDPSQFVVDLAGNPVTGTQTLSLVDTVPPHFLDIHWIDNDGNGQISLGDHYTFQFSEAMDTAVIQDGTTDANYHLRPEGGKRYGTTNSVSWNLEGTACTVEITDGYTIIGNETVVPSSFVQDVAGNSVVGTRDLSGADADAPEFVYLRFDDMDGNGLVSVGDRYVFGFSEPMTASAVSNNTTEANENLSPEGMRYGDLNDVTWNGDFTECVVGITDGFTVVGDEVVTPSAALTDPAGNPLANTVSLTVADTIPPAIVAVEPNYESPVVAVTDFRITVQFTSGMDTSQEPIITLTSSGVTQPVVPSGGSWTTRLHPGDTYTTPEIVLSVGMDGDIQVNVSGAADMAGNVMVPASNVHQFLLDTRLLETAFTSGVSEGETVCSGAVSLCWEGIGTAASPEELQYSWKLDDAGWSASDFESCQSFTGLAEGEHSFFVYAHDDSGNVDTTPAVRHFQVDGFPPVLSGIEVSEGADQVTVTWQTNEPATSVVAYGTTPVYESGSVTQTGLTTDHSVTVSGLSPETDYHYRVQSTDGCQREALSADRTFSTVPDIDMPDTEITTGPPADGKACATTVEICWTGTDNVTAPANLQYKYKIDADPWSAWTFDQCHSFSGLSEGAHTLQVYARDTQGNIDGSPAVLNFFVDLTAPEISESSIAVAERVTTASVTWNTNEPTTSQVEYGLSESYGMQTSLDTRQVGSHRVVLGGLAPETTYHFRVRSSDDCQEDVSSDGTFTTLAVQPPNLTVGDFNVPPSGTYLSQLSLRWRIRNAGQGDAAGPWMDRIYISTDQVIDDDDFILAEFERSQGLTAYQDYWKTETVAMPILPDIGPYYVILKTDDGETVAETQEGDNTAIRGIDYTAAKLMTVVPDTMKLNVNPGVPISGEIHLANLSNDAFTGITATVQDAPGNISIDIDPPAELGPLSSAVFAYAVTASDESVLEASPSVRFSCAQMEETGLTLDITVIPRKPDLVSMPGYLESTMLRGKRNFVEWEVANIGGVPANNLQVVVPEAPWLSLVTAGKIGTLAAGEKTRIAVMLHPADDLELGPYTGTILVTGNNAGVPIGIAIGFRFTARSEEWGDLRILAKDEFSFFAEDHPNLADASVLVKDAFSDAVVVEGTTDASGIFLAEDLAEGRYFLEVSAERHGTHREVIEIEAGEELEVIAFLPRELVTYNWIVEPIEIEDTYKISLEAVFETHVPAPVITVEPRTSVVPVIEGRTTTVDVTITNHGLIAVNGMSFTFDSHPLYYVIPTIEDIGKLPAMTSITIPVKVRRTVDGPIEDLSGQAAATMSAQFADYEETLAAADTGGFSTAGSAGGGDSGYEMPSICDFLSGKVRSYYVCIGDEWKEISVGFDAVSLALDIFGCGEALLTGNPMAYLDCACSLAGADPCACALTGGFSVGGAINAFLCSCGEGDGAPGDDPPSPPSDPGGGGPGGGDWPFGGASLSGPGKNYLTENRCGPKPPPPGTSSTASLSTTQSDESLTERELEIHKYGGRVIRYKVLGR